MDDRPWDITPGVGAGPLRFGTPREELRAVLGPGEAFRRGAVEHLTDAYDESRLMLTCSPGEGLYFIEFGDPAGIRLGGVELAGPGRKVVERLRAAGFEAAKDDAGWNLAGGAVALYAPSARVEGVAVAAPGFELGAALVVREGGPDAVTPSKAYTVHVGRGVGHVEFGQHRDEVRRRASVAAAFDLAPGSRVPVQDYLWDDGLVVGYDADLRVDRIIVERADRVMLGGVNLKPPLREPAKKLRATLLEAGHDVTDLEAGFAIDGTGVQVWTARVKPSLSLPVAHVAVARQP